MSTSTAGPFTHQAFFYDDTDGFLAGMVPFVEAGLSKGERVLVAIDQAKGEALRAALPQHNGDVHFADMAVLGRNPGRIISAWAEFVAEHTTTGRHVRGIGEPVWRGRTPAELVECQRHEALLNLAFADQQGFTLVCPYDRSQLDELVLTEAARSHPELTADGRTLPSAAYEAQVEPFTGNLPEPDAPVQLEFGDQHLGELRRRVAEHTQRMGLDRDRTDDLLVAVTEAVTNSIRHATGRGMVRIWREGERVVCEVSDEGRRIDDPLAGRLKAAAGATGGRGLWLIHQLCDLVEIRSSDLGNRVRMHVYC